jgi:hypothetical protein
MSSPYRFIGKPTRRQDAVEVVTGVERHGNFPVWGVLPPS